MIALDDVRATALALPEVVEGETGHHREAGWSVRGKPVAWVRPLRQRDVADLEALGAPVPQGTIIAVRVPREEKAALLASVAGAFDIPHFRGYPAVLVELESADADELRELISDAWLVQAPKRLAKQWLAAQGLADES